MPLAVQSVLQPATTDSVEYRTTPHSRVAQACTIELKKATKSQKESQL
jgi:hypothetical protein